MAASRTSSVQAERDIIDLPLEVKAGGMPGEFEGYGAVFGNIDRDGDVVTKGAFADSLKERLPALLWQHNPKEPIGRFDVVREDAKGLFVKGRLSQTGKGAEAYELLKMGALNGLSIGFVTKEAQRSSASGARQITRADLMEVSLVTFPANELARVQTVKQRKHALNSQTDSEDPSIHDPRSFERFLRENGFSRSRAKTITAKGFKSGEQEINHSSLVDILEAKKTALQMMIDNDFDMKDFRKLVVTAHSGGYKNLWQHFPAFTVDKPSSFKLKYSIHAPRSGPFTLKIRYQSKNGMRVIERPSHGIRNTSFPIPEGTQQVSIQAKSGAGYAQHVIVLLTVG